MGAIADLFRVIYEPVPVFERVRERRPFLLPFIVYSVITIVLGLLTTPYRKAAMASQLAANPQAAAAAEKFASIGSFLAPIVVLLVIAIGASILWVLVSLVGGDANWRTLASMEFYAGVATLLYQFVVFGVLVMTGVNNIHSQADLIPPLGLDLLAPHAGPVLTRFLGGINPFSLWGAFLTAVGIEITQKTSKGAAWTVAIISLLISVGLAAFFAGLAPK